MSRIFLLTLFILLTACSDNKEEPVVQDTVFQGHIDALDKAKATEQALQDALEKQRQAIEDSGG